MEHPQLTSLGGGIGVIEKDRSDSESQELGEISSSACARLLAMHTQEVCAINVTAGGDRYPDFFVEGPGNPPGWHERFGDKGPRPFHGDDLAANSGARVHTAPHIPVAQAYLRLRSSLDK
ncbi:hypothetical protein [Streptantibioticus ferralitis]|uniref:Uncharacterized protein n=1 Tax=Streptantibioticus ferralitis TaxID=236510 RepID=A0ABT5YZ39_9ACTN|nr:hypothetical protein [Streptantibioticus ferralitis]MDF2256814.1 hypothetical protein [Streptantibioticus ferralitis]